MACRYKKMMKRDYHKYDYLWFNKKLEEFDELIAELRCQEHMQRNRLKTISSETGIPHRTLRDWRAKLQHNPDWKPTYGRPGPHALTVEREKAVYESLTNEYLSEQRLCTRQVVAHKLTVEGRDLHGGDFEAGPKLVRSFLERHNLSLRKPHLKRRTEPDDTNVSAFLQRVDLVFCQFPKSLVFNVDETCWRLVNGTLKTVARTGADAVNVAAKSTTKTDITVIAACSADGEKLPLWILARGKGKKSEEKFRNCPKLARLIDRKVFVEHSTSGWSTAEVMIRYLRWLKSYKQDRMIHVLWDLYPAHQDPRVIDAASAEEIGLTFIPAGQTGEWQPLDRRIFGSLKQRATKILNERMINESFEQYNIMDAVAILAEAWDQVTQEEILKSWAPLVPPAENADNET